MDITRKVARSMVTQLDRVNTATLDDLREQLEQAQRRIRLLETALAKYEGQPEALPARGYVETREGKFWNGEKVFTLDEAARRAGISYWIAYRYVSDGYWSAYQLEDRKWLVYATNSFARRPRQKRR